MSEKIVQLNEEVIKGQIKELVRGSVEETLNELLEKEAESLTQAARYERSEARQATAAATTTGISPPPPVTSRSMYPGSSVSFETAIIERYRRRESSVEEASSRVSIRCKCSKEASGFTGSIVPPLSLRMRDT